MEAYIQAASQVKEDITEEFFRCFPEETNHDPKNIKGEARRVLDNIEIVFRNSAKNRLFTQRIRKLPKTRLEKDELVYAYLATDNEDSYNDSISAISCCKKISYLLFTCRYNNYGIAERNKYQDILRKQERLCPEKNIEIYNSKKELVELMTTGPATYAEVEPLVTQYLNALHVLLEGQMTIYRVERELNVQFAGYLNDIIDPDSKYSKTISEPNAVKGLITAFNALKQRGLDIPSIKTSLQTTHIYTVKNEIDSYLELLTSEIKNLKLVCSFTSELIKYIETAKQKENREAQQEKNSTDEEKKFFLSIKESLSNTFQDWLNK